MHAPSDQDPGSAHGSLDPAAPTSRRPTAGPGWLTCDSRPDAANACFAPVSGPIYPALARRLLAGAIDLVLCAWFFVLAVALVHLSAPDARLHLEDVLVRAAALGTVMFLLYFHATESSPLQASVGKRLLGMKVMDAQGHAPGFERSALRFALTLAGLASAGLTFLPALRSRRGRCLQDRLSGTVVVMRDALPGQLRLHRRVAHRVDDRLSLAFCAALAVAGTGALPWWQQQQVTMRVERSVHAARAVGDAVAREIALQGRVPDEAAALGTPLRLEDGDARVERLAADGSFDLRLQFEPVHGARLRMKPVELGADGRGTFRCLALDLPEAYRPAGCQRVD